MVTTENEHKHGKIELVSSFVYVIIAGSLRSLQPRLRPDHR